MLCCHLTFVFGFRVVMSDDFVRPQILQKLTTEMLALSEAGDNSGVDMLVGDIYGSDANKIGLKASTIASTFGKVFRKSTTREERSEMFKQADIARSLLYAISNNIGHVA
jgi:type II pantothenate kinase